MKGDIVSDEERIKDRLSILEHSIYSINNYLVESKTLDIKLKDIKFELANLERKRQQLEEVTKQMKEERQQLLKFREEKDHVEKKTRGNKDKV